MENNKVDQNCPSELELCDYLDRRLNPEREDELLKHIAGCSNCLALLELGHKVKEGNFDQITTAMLKRAKNIAPLKSKNRLLFWLWPGLAGICFIGSFVVARYFLQFLVLAVIFSVKWIFDTGSTRTLIMIYQAWRNKDSAGAQRIIRDFQDQFTQRH